MKPLVDNIFENIPGTLPEELFENLIDRETLKIERIVSHGHCTPAGQWYGEASDEWVLLLQGQATLGYEDELLTMSEVFRLWAIEAMHM